MTVSVTSETALFGASSQPATDTVTARAAYQLALCGRAAILDLRTGRERTAEGQVPSMLTESRADQPTRLIALVGSDGLSLGLPHIAGGFAAWRSAGMPLG